MNSEDITTIDELTEFMTAEAALWGRNESEQKTVNGHGIRQQWEDRDKFPYPIFYLAYSNVLVTDDTFEFSPELPPVGKRVQFDLKAMWFDEEGNVTKRPAK